MTHPPFVSMNDTARRDGEPQRAPETADRCDLPSAVRSLLHG